MIRSHVHLSGGLLARPLAGVPLVAIDLETTGLDVLRDRVIEIGLARWDPPRAGQHGRLSLYSHRVDPGRSVPRRAAEITGISSESLVGAPSFRDVLPTLRRFCDGAVAVLHNADADLGYLSGELGRANTTLELDGVLDTLAIARFVYRLPRANLDALAARLGFPHDRPHRALPDALATLRAARAFLAAWTGEPTAEALARAVVDPTGQDGPASSSNCATPPTSTPRCSSTTRASGGREVSPSGAASQSAA